MTVSVGYFAVLREQRGLSSESVATEAATLGDLYSELRARHGFSVEARWVRPALNDEFASMSDPVRDGDRVIFMPPVAGG